MSGIAATRQGLFVQDDRRGELLKVDSDCRVAGKVPLPGVGGLRDTEDLASTPDGSLWIADTGGNRFRRTTVTVVQVPAAGRPVTYQFSYPDGPHDAETLLVSPDHRQMLIVTKVPTGVSTVFAPAGPLRPGGSIPLEAVGTVRINALTERNPGKSALLVTGGAVSPDGLHVVLRTYNEAWEWDAADGDLVAALTAPPRKVELPDTKQGEAITYTADGQTLLAAGEQLDPIFRVSIDRPRYAPTRAATEQEPYRPVDRGSVARVLVLGGLVCLLGLIGAVLAERRRSRRGTFPPDDGPPVLGRVPSRNRDSR